MKYVIKNEEGTTEIREDSNPLQDGAIELTDAQYDQLVSGEYILSEGELVLNPTPR